MIVSPVHWYMASTPLKAMIDRLVCADGGNPDPTATHGKDAAKAKALELKGWPYPRHLGDRLFSVVVHGDVEGAENVRRSISDWLQFMELRPAGRMAELDRYIGYHEPYATSHQPRRARPGHRRPGGGPQRRADAPGRGRRAPGGALRGHERVLEGAPEQVTLPGPGAGLRLGRSAQERPRCKT
jgi:multimeric flavodoxin WrbA